MMVQAEQQVEDSDEGENSALLSPQPSTNNTPVRVTRTGTLLDSTEVFVPETPEQRDTFGTYFLEHNDSQSQRVPDTQICNMVIMKTVMTLNVLLASHVL